ncbi:hypothetical protein [Pelobium manganitolerans]|uniref:hypothetical protein n=1 Tax=Pelobium manganitolerans TaxID=1842495 RepID=UPI003FA3B645
MNGLLVALIIISFLIKAYQNFKKESEKAAERAKQADAQRRASQSQTVPTVPHPPVLVEQPSRKQTAKTLQEEHPRQAERKSAYRAETNPAYQTVPVQNKKAVKQKELLTTDYYNPEIPSAEVLANRKIHEKHKHGIKLPKRERHVAADFNFKQALIYDAILHRPKY